MKIFLCGDAMTGRGIDQILRQPCDPIPHETFRRSAFGYVQLAEQAHGPIARPVDFEYIWGAAMDEWRRQRSHARVINLETSVTRSEDFAPKGVNDRMSPENAACLNAAGIECCARQQPSARLGSWLRRMLDRESARFGVRVARGADGRLAAMWGRARAAPAWGGKGGS